jgi:SAM-dependent methyltransferase
VTGTARSRSFDLAAAEYERGRPGYPEALLDLVPVDRGATVLDLGAGTGKLTRVLAARYARTIAVEPLDGMRAILEREVPHAEAHAGAAEAIPLRDVAVDAVFAAQAYHWFATDPAVAEIARVLRSGGVLVLVWNEPSPSRPSPLPGAYRRRFSELHGRVPDDDEESTRFAPIERAPFGPLESASVEHEQVSDRDGILAFAASMSWIAHRPQLDREAILHELAGLLPPGEYTFPMRTEVTWAVRS